MRWARAAVVSALTLVVALTSHVLAGGAAGSWWALAVVAVVVTPLCWWWSDRRWRSLELLTVLGLAQGLLHVLFATGGAAAGAAHAAHHTGPSMVVAHGVATLVTLVLVRQADAAVHALAAVVRSVLDVLLPGLGDPVLPATRRSCVVSPHPTPFLVSRPQLGHPDRGPPARSLSLTSPTPAR